MTNIGNFDESAKDSNASLLKIFENSEFGKVRAALINGEPWFIGVDVAKALGYIISKNAIRDNVDIKDKKVVQLSDFQVGPQYGLLQFKTVDLIRKYLDSRAGKTKKTVQEIGDQLDLFSYER